MYDVTNLPLCCRYNLKKLTYEQRKASLVERLNALNSSAGADDDDEEEDNEWESSLITVVSSYAAKQTPYGI